MGGQGARKATRHGRNNARRDIALWNTIDALLLAVFYRKRAS